MININQIISLAGPYFAWLDFTSTTAKIKVRVLKVLYDALRVIREFDQSKWGKIKVNFTGLGGDSKYV